jgi:nitrite reductase (NADH) small subunit
MMTIGWAPTESERHTSTETVSGWIAIGALADIPRLGARVVRTGQGAVAVFRTATDEVFALDDRCPHRGGPLSQGIVYGRRVACPLHNWVIDLGDGCAAPPDQGCTRSHAVRVDDGRVFLRLSASPGPQAVDCDRSAPA